MSEFWRRFIESLPATTVACPDYADGCVAHQPHVRIGHSCELHRVELTINAGQQDCRVRGYKCYSQLSERFPQRPRACRRFFQTSRTQTSSLAPEARRECSTAKAVDSAMEFLGATLRFDPEQRVPVTEACSLMVRKLRDQSSSCSSRASRVVAAT